MIYVLKLVGEEGVKNILNISDEKGVIKYLNSINELGLYTISNMKHNLSIYGIFFFKQGYCIVDMDFSEFKPDLFSKNYMIYNNLIAFIRDEKLKKLGLSKRNISESQKSLQTQTIKQIYKLCLSELY